MSTDELEKQILLALDAGKEVQTYTIAQEQGIDHQKVIGVVKSVEAYEIVDLAMYTVTEVRVSKAGQDVIAHGSPEYRVWAALGEAGEAGMKQSDIEAQLGKAVGKEGFSIGMKSKWFSLKKDGKQPFVVRAADAVEDAVQSHVAVVAEGKADSLAKADLDAVKKRKLIDVVNVKGFTVTKGAKFTTERTALAVELTPAMISSGEWKDTLFKKYNFNAMGLLERGGNLHPLLKVRTAYRQILLEMGFQEMPTNKYVESSFWNFDTLFQPQQHPARDSHDTFFVKSPSPGLDSVDPAYLERVKNVHEKGGYGSLGYRTDWDVKEAEKLVLRTHTTAVSSRMLYDLANQPGGYKPAKMFSIDRVFRNEASDATHLSEFSQIEGVITDYNVTLGDLIGTLRTFFERFGIKKLRFKPAYNPYTEPSMEIFGFHPQLNRWVEIGNSGMFRPEMLQTYGEGWPKGAKAIAWGLSLERPCMIRYGIANIRDLVGHKTDLSMTRNTELFRPEKEGRNE